MHWQAGFLPLVPPEKPMFLYAAAAAKLLQSCLTLCDPMDYSPPGSSVQGHTAGKWRGQDGHQGLSYPQAYVLLSPQSNQHFTFFPTASLQCVETACLGYLGLILVDGKGKRQRTRT